MANERDLLRELQSVLAEADVDVTSLVEGAWEDAREEVRATLTRLMAHDLLRRSLGTLQGGSASHGAAADVAQGGASDAVEGGASGVAHDGPAAAPAPEGTTDTAVHADAPEDPPAELATYLFGVVGGEVTLPEAELPQLPGGGPVRLLPAARCQALVCDVDPSSFEALREATPDGLELLAAAAYVHDEVLATFAQGPVLPLGLGTVLPDDQAVEGLLVRHADRLETELDRIRGRSEWAVTVHEPAPEAAPPAEGPAATSGHDYLEQRRAALQARESRWEQEERVAASFHGPLAACARDAVEVGARPLEQDDPPLLHGVYLLDDDARDRFDSTVEYLRAEHPDVEVEVTGPWPPYHFTSLDLSDDAPTDQGTP
ncbi:GvpL/GvpF family gas vesicle protein [Egibacter rhizosphaerae]|uniref:GvpL/GvpF family gas vesicle protein n=1 Tax=Egibacter rhizosphaerae TaxID=1670831 RepID=A0A411YBV9_9ACTN|nr:GvpL/GvpF family gas vesicle protein [Egibacter rhizosphaerae]QBI18690.1 GvpL/GvpF family gas vesicle protein [Egibacter rhizosphaerae]